MIRAFNLSGQSRDPDNLVFAGLNACSSESCALQV